MKFALFLFFTLTYFHSYAQTPIWVNSIGSNSVDEAFSIDVDVSGNVYLSGRFSGVADFDPGPAISNLSSNGLTDGYIAKYTQSGQLVWAFNIGGNSYDGAQKVKINNAGEVLVTGYYRNNVDFDPSSNTFFLNGTGLAGTDVGFGGDIFVAKYTSGGAFVWAFEIRGSYSQDKTEGMDVDVNDNIYIAGAVNTTSTYIIDADPGIGVYDIGGLGKGNGFVAKYSTNANFIWAFNFGGYGLNSGAHKIKLIPGDSSFVIAGFFNGINVDFDPNAGTYLRTTNGVEDLVIAKYSINKDFMWAYTTGGIGADVGLELDIDQNKNIYMSGWFNGTNIDFNPSPTIANNLTSNGGNDSYILKYTNSGNFIWAKSFGSVQEDIGYSLSLQGNELLVAGEFRGTVDFDPSINTFNMSSFGGSDIFISRFDTIGNFLCAEQIGGLSNERAYSILSVLNDSFYVCGNFSTNNIDFDPSISGILSKANYGQSDAYIGKFSKNSLIETLNPILIGDTICQGNIGSLTIDFGAGSLGSYNVLLNDGVSTQTYFALTSGSIINPIPMPTATTTYTLVSISPVVVNCNTINIPSGVTATILVNPSPNITATASPVSVCSGNPTTLTANGALTYVWSGGVTNGMSFIPTSTSTYTVIGTDINGCTSSSSITVIMNSLPIVSALAAPSSVCLGTSTIISGQGALNYTFTGGIFNGVPFFPTTPNTYTVVGVDANGCSNSATTSITILSSPSVSILANPYILCQGESTILTASGALTYNWSGGVTNGIPFVPTSSTTYTVIATDGNGCTDVGLITFTINNLPNIIATASPISVCNGSPTTLTASGGFTYSWTGGVTSGIPFIPLTTTTYTVTGTDANGCSNTSAVTVNVGSSLFINITPSNPILCLGDSVQLNAIGGLTYSWLPNININSTTISNPIVYPNATTTYIVTGSDASGCTGTASVTIEVIEDPKISISKSGDIECNIKTIQLSANGASNYSWSPSFYLSSPNSSTTNATITQPTVFTVVASIGSCIVTDSIMVNVYENDETSFYIPNAFSPNGDGLNDCLRVMNKANFKKYYFAIYNRWGQRVFESDNTLNCWDGNFNNQLASQNTYYYYLEAETNCGKVFRKGDILLLR